MSDARAYPDPAIMDEITSILQEGQTAYLPSNHVQPQRFSDIFTNKLLVVSLIRSGVSYALFKLIHDESPYSEADWSEILGLSLKSLQRYKKNNTSFKPLQSEKIIEMAEVTQRGVDTFGSRDRFQMWLYTPSYALGQIKPLDLLKDSYGKDMVLRELFHIDHGILA